MGHDEQLSVREHGATRLAGHEEQSEPISEASISLPHQESAVQTEPASEARAAGGTPPEQPGTSPDTQQHTSDAAPNPVGETAPEEPANEVTSIPSQPVEERVPEEPSAQVPADEANTAPDSRMPDVPPAQPPAIAYDRDAGSSGVIRLRPTPSQWDDFPLLLSTARSLGALEHGCFKIVPPEGVVGPVPARVGRRAPANAYRVRLVGRTRMWQVDTVGAEGWFPGSDEDGSNKDFDGTTDEALSRLRTLLTKHRGRRIRDVRYRVDVPAWTARQRSEAGVPPRSALHPLRGDRLDRTRAVVPGIHTPYVYESGPAFGATFQIHAEDYRLCSLNHIHAGRKIWIVIPPGGMAQAEDAFTSGKSSSSSKGRRKRCSQFMRHRAEFVFPDTLTRMAVPHAVVDQRAGETLVILPDAYHQGFSTGYTLAEAKNYADEAWDPRPGEGGYMPCDAASCNLPTAIPPYLMEMMGEDEDESARIDLCAWHEGAEAREAAADEQAGNDVPVKDAPVEDDAPGEQDAPSEDAPGEQDAPGEDAPGEDAPGEDAPDPYAWPDEVKRPRDESGDVDMPPAQRARLTA